MTVLPSHLELVQGVVLPKPVGADPVLDFVNTRSDWTTPGPAGTEWLTSYEAFLIWTSYVGLSPPATVFRLMEQASGKPTEAARRQRAALEFRADLYDVLSGRATGQAVRHATGEAAGGAFEAAARLIETASGRRRLAQTDEGASWELPEDLAQPLDHVALRAGDLLTGSSRAHVRVCPGESCGWLFLDPRGRRRWCSMATCGNRAKVRAHAARTR